MDNIVLAPDNQRKKIFTNVADKLHLPPWVVEKDFYVSWVLGKMFANPELHDILRLNGSVSLSKVYNVIQRTCSDVDFILKKDVVLKPEEKLEQPSKTKQLFLRRQIEKRDATFIQSVLKDTIFDSVSGICSVEGNKNGHVLELSYNQVFEYEYIPPTIKLEIGSLVLWEPHEEHQITSFVSNVLPELRIKNPNIPTITATMTFWA